MKKNKALHPEDKTSGNTISYWIDSSQPIIYEKLNTDIETEIAIVGGGISGLTTAYCLCKEGKKVILIEDGNIGSGESGRTTAQISNALDDGYSKISELFGLEGARLSAESHTAAINKVEEIIKAEKIECDFQKLSGYLFLDPTDNKKELRDEYNVTHKAGLKTLWHDETPSIKNIESPCIEFPDQAQFHILKYLKGLCDAITRMGGKIYTDTHAKEIVEGKIVTSDGNTITCSSIVVATNSPVNDTFAMHTKQAAYRTYVIGVKIKKDTLPKALWWDTGDQDSKWESIPYHYVRLQNFDNEFDLLIVGGEDHKTGQQDDEEEKYPDTDHAAEDRFTNLSQWTRKHFPDSENVIYKWSGQVLEPVDCLAYIGKNPGDDNIYIVTGDSGNGMTHGTIAGMLLTDLISERENSWSKIYDPSRKPPVSMITDYISGGLNVAKQMLDYVKPGDVASGKDLKAGEGGIISHGLNKYAVYKDKENVVHTFTAVCPHIKCIVHWNEAESTFDCPCHGSRFTALGKVINGPALTDLEKVEL